MNDINNELKRVSEQIVQKRQLAVAIQALEKQLAELEKSKDELKMQFQKEKNDADKLEGWSLHNLWLDMTGELEDLKDEEQREAIIASVHLHAAEKQIETLTEQKESLLSELSGLSGCEKQYETLIAQKEAYLRSTDPVKAESFRAYDKAAYMLDTLINKIDAAESTGSSIKIQIGIICSSLNSAENWGKWDLLGGGLISHVVKYSRLDDAQTGISHLQTLLERFNSLLSDVCVSREMTIQIDGFLRFADWFFDGLIVDWTVLSRIQDSQQQLSCIEGSIVNALDQLSRMRKETSIKRAEVQRARMTLIEQS